MLIWYCCWDVRLCIVLDFWTVIQILHQCCLPAFKGCITLNWTVLPVLILHITDDYFSPPPKKKWIVVSTVLLQCRYRGIFSPSPQTNLNPTLNKGINSIWEAPTRKCLMCTTTWLHDEWFYIYPWFCSKFIGVYSQRTLNLMISWWIINHLGFNKHVYHVSTAAAPAADSVGALAQPAGLLSPLERQTSPVYIMQYPRLKTFS